jgi:hypothetical protein
MGMMGGGGSGGCGGGHGGGSCRFYAMSSTLTTTTVLRNECILVINCPTTVSRILGATPGSHQGQVDLDGSTKT